MIRAILVLTTSLLLAAPAAMAASADQAYQADLSVKSAQVETLRARAAMAPSTTTTATMIEVENLLRQYRAAEPGKRDSLRAQLEAALVRLELEIDSAGRSNRP
ncbi:MAG: hypothetical protein AB7G62_04055 [Magnetospirillum sp.]